MVVRLEKTDRSASSLGHDWMFRTSDNKNTEIIIRLTLPGWNVSYITCAHVNTCYFSDSAEHFQLFGIQGWNVFKIISAKI